MHPLNMYEERLKQAAYRYFATLDRIAHSIVPLEDAAEEALSPKQAAELDRAEAQLFKASEDYEAAKRWHGRWARFVRWAWRHW